MKATLEFNLPDDANDFLMAANAQKYSIALWDIKQMIRSVLKHGSDKELDEILSDIRELIPTDDELGA